MRRPPRITLTIDRLVLRGFPAAAARCHCGRAASRAAAAIGRPGAGVRNESTTCQRAGNAPVDDELKSEADRRPGRARIGPEPPIMTRSAVKAPTTAAPAATSSTASGLLQRKCACGGEAGSRRRMRGVRARETAAQASRRLRIFIACHRSCTTRCARPVSNCHIRYAHSSNSASIMTSAGFACIAAAKPMHRHVRSMRLLTPLGKTWSSALDVIGPIRRLD